MFAALNLPATTNVVALPDSSGSGSTVSSSAAQVLANLPDPRLIQVADVTVVLGADYRGPGAPPSPTTTG